MLTNFFLTAIAVITCILLLIQPFKPLCHSPCYFDHIPDISTISRHTNSSCASSAVFLALVGRQRMLHSILTSILCRIWPLPQSEQQLHHRSAPTRNDELSEERRKILRWEWWWLYFIEWKYSRLSTDPCLLQRQMAGVQIFEEMVSTFLRVEWGYWRRRRT